MIYNNLETKGQVCYLFFPQYRSEWSLLYIFAAICCWGLVIYIISLKVLCKFSFNTRTDKSLILSFPITNRRGKVKKEKLHFFHANPFLKPNFMKPFLNNPACENLDITDLILNLQNTVSCRQLIPKLNTLICKINMCVPIDRLG